MGAHERMTLNSWPSATGVVNELEAELYRLKAEERGNWRAL